MIEAIGDVALDDPGGAFPGSVDFSQRRVASSFWSKAMRMVTKCPLKIAVQDGPDYLSQEFVAPDGHAERSFLPIFLRHIGSPRWLPLVSSYPHSRNAAPDFFHFHTIS